MIVVDVIKWLHVQIVGFFLYFSLTQRVNGLEAVADGLHLAAFHGMVAMFARNKMRQRLIHPIY